MAPIKNVAVAGANGILGPAVISALLSSSFNVTLLTRSGSTHPPKPHLPTIPVDYTSTSSLTAALRGQDALISLIGGTSLLAPQRTMIAACLAAGVRRFIASEFGSDTCHPRARAMPCYGEKVAVQELLEEAVAVPQQEQEQSFSYTLLMTGPFFDWGIATANLLMDTKGHQVTLYDGGDVQFSVSSLATVGRAVAGVLAHPNETRNRAVYVQDCTVSLRGLLEIARQAAPETEWVGSEVQTEEVERRAWEGMKAWKEGGEKDGEGMMGWFYGFLTRVIFAEGYGSRFGEVDNALLGISQMTAEEVGEYVGGFVKMADEKNGK